MYKCQMMRALVNERLTAAAEEIFALFEKTIVEYEEELENQRKQLHQQHQADGPRFVQSSGNVPLPPTSPGQSLNRTIPETVQIKEELEEQSVKEDDEEMPVPAPEFKEAFVEAAEYSMFLQRQTEHREDTPGQQDMSSEPNFLSEADTLMTNNDDDEDDWDPPFIAAQMKTEADHYSQMLIRDSEPETSASVSNGAMSGAAKESERRKHSCYICKKIFREKRALQIHIRVHLGQKPHSCLVCKKTFTAKGSLKVHERIHTGEKPFSCSFCWKTFVQKSDLVRHLRTHTGEKPYRCPFCWKTFAQRFNLDRHRKTHTGQ